MARCEYRATMQQRKSVNDVNHPPLPSQPAHLLVTARCWLDNSAIDRNTGFARNQALAAVWLIGQCHGGKNMLIPFTCVLLLSPAILVELSIDRSIFPKGADNWDRVGLFKLKDGKNERLVLLYCCDSD